MLMDGETLRKIMSGEVTLQFRRWKRPTVKAGGTLLTAVGLLAIDEVERTTDGDLTDDDAVAAGYADADELRAVLEKGRRGGDLYRIALRYAGPDPRIALREDVPDSAAIADLRRRLDGYDARSPTGPWVRGTLEAIRDAPGTRAADLATSVGMEKARFKGNVRKLKGLGLTVSLEVGYRLSPRGRAVLSALVETAHGG